jgi:hypothetical protein
MSMRDVSPLVRDIQPLPLFRRTTTHEAESDAEGVLPGSDLAMFDRNILDPSRPDGITYHRQPLSAARITDAASKSTAAGRAFVVERSSGLTRLFFVWVPTPLVQQIQARSLTAPVNFHVLFHPPTYEPWYMKSRPYWQGKFEGVPQYVKLGIRYLCEDFKAVVHHVMASTDSDPQLAYVVPVADYPANFSDLVIPDGMTAVLSEIVQFLSNSLAAQPPQIDEAGRIMLSAYSRSGNRLVSLMSRLSQKSDFFARRLTQVNAFDINLGDTDEQRLPELARLWQAVGQWSSMNPHTRAYLYTAYRSHYDYCYANPVPRGNHWFEVANVNLDQVDWSDKNARAASGLSRGTASEAYASQRRFGLVCLPVSFFQYYIPNELPGKIDIKGNQARGWHDGQYHLGSPFHGHGLFLRGMLSHAIAHAHPDFFVPKAKRASEVVRVRP